MKAMIAVLLLAGCVSAAPPDFVVENKCGIIVVNRMPPPMPTFAVPPAVTVNLQPYTFAPPVCTGPNCTQQKTTFRQSSGWHPGKLLGR